MSGHSCELLFDLATWEPEYYDNPDQLINSATEWRIECAMPPGQGTAQPVVIEKNDGQRSAAFTVDYAPPKVSTITSSSTGGPVIPSTQRVTAPTGGFTMTIAGSDFGVWPRVLVGQHTIYAPGDKGAPLSNANWFTAYSHTELTFVVPDGVGRDQGVGIMPPDDGFNLPLYPFDYEPPTISTIAYSSSPTRGEQPLEIVGTNFGPVSASNVPQVTVGGRPCTSVVVATPHTRLTCLSPPGQGKEQPVEVTVGTQTATLTGPDAYHYQPPTIDELQLPSSRRLAGSLSYSGSAMRGPTQGGFNITVTGSDLGEPGEACVFVTSVVALDAAITAAAASGGGVVPHDGGPLKCNGMSSFPGEGELPASLILVHTHDKIVFEMPPGMGRKLISVKIKGQSNMEAVTTTPNFVYDDPVVDSASPSTGPTLGGTLVTLTGANFGFPPNANNQQFMQISFHTTCVSNATTSSGTVPSTVEACQRGLVVYHDHTTIQFLTPGGIGTDRAIGVSIWDGGVRGDAPVPALFSFQPPVVELVFPNPLQFEAAALPVEIRGTNFGRFADSASWTPLEREVTVLVQGEECSSARRVPGTDSSLSCLLAAPTVGHKNLSITVAGQTGTVSQSDDRAIYSVCAKGYYGQEGEPCLPCPRGAEVRTCSNAPPGMPPFLTVVDFCAASATAT